ncbi:MAG: cytochrome c biogenesis protein CcsA [Bryobacteraceae bacterium]
MAELSVIWLRAAVALYSLGLIHAILSLMRRDRFFRPVLAAFSTGVTLHLVSIVEEAALIGNLPVQNLYESVSLCAFLIAAFYLFVYWRYRMESLSTFVFPLVFIMTLTATFGNPVSTWSSSAVRDMWLTVHIVSILAGYAALLLTALGAVLYLVQERELKRKRPYSSSYRLPPLGILDDLISKSMTAGFAAITLGIVTGSTWAFIELGTSWLADQRIAIAFATWGIYLAMVFLRVNAGWRGRKAAIMAITALGCCVVTWATHAGLLSIQPQ